MKNIQRKLLILTVTLVAAYLGWDQADFSLRGSAPNASVAPADSGVELIAAAWEQRANDVDVEATGTVRRVLRDDNEGSRHQRFTLELSNGQTVLIAHNIDLAPRVENVRLGDSVRFKGVYEWNDRGGVVHWTHHDPRGRRAGGWLEHNGRRYE